MELTCFLCYVVGAFVIYKLLDRLLRKPRLGSLAEKYIFVTGCDTGFGHHISRRLDTLGCHVFAGCLTEAGETELKKLCSNRLVTVQLDVSNSESVQKAYQQVEAALPKGKGLWGILNNAGIAGIIGPFEWLKLKDYHQVFGVNLLGLIDTTVTFLPLLKRNGGGRIVNTASVFGRVSLTGSTPYCISKYGVEAFSDAARRQLKMFDISVHLIEPGFHKTNITETTGLERNLRTAWKQASAEVQSEYGETFLEKSIDDTLKVFVSGIISERIEDVVDAYEHALIGRFPRARYVVGNDAKFFWLPVNTWIPEWLGDWLLFKLAGAKNNLPQAVQDRRYKKK